jgi:cytochrome c
MTFVRCDIIHQTNLPMKKIFVIAGLSLLLYACGGNSGDKTEQDTTSLLDHKASEAAPAPTAADTAAPVDTTAKPRAAEPALPSPKPVEKKDKKDKDVATGSVKGGKLLKAADCLTCHREDVKLVGPAYADVAKKYKPTTANIDMLAGKIIAGGSGNWGQIPMTPHPNVSKDDAKEMVKYILAVK